MSVSHKENTLYVNGKVLNDTYEKLTNLWDQTMAKRPDSILAGEKAIELEKLTNLDMVTIPSIEEQVNLYIENAMDTSKNLDLERNSNTNQQDEGLRKETKLRPEAERIERILSNMGTNIQTLDELKSARQSSKLASFKLLAQIEDQRFKTEKNYIYDKYADPNPSDGGYKSWRTKMQFMEQSEITRHMFYKITIYHPFKYTKMLEYLCLGHHTLQDLADSIYCVSDFILHGKQNNGQINSFFFIENTFYYHLNETYMILDDESEDLDEVDHCIQQHNDEFF